jgi:hypothetical protein
MKPVAFLGLSAPGARFASGQPQFRSATP